MKPFDIVLTHFSTSFRDCEETMFEELFLSLFTTLLLQVFLHGELDFSRDESRTKLMDLSLPEL